MQTKLVLPITLLAALLTTPPVPAQDTAHDLQAFSQLRARPAYLGVGIVDVDADRVSRLKLSEERGVEVTNVEEGSPADSAGIKPGDVLLTYNGETVLGAQQFVRLVRETPVGRKVRLTLWRNGKEQTVTVTTGLPQPIIREETRQYWFTPMGDGSSRMQPDIPSVIMAWQSSMLGIECEPIGPQLAQFFGVKQGVLVRSVGKGTAGDKAGLRAGDVITSVGNQALKSPDDLRRVLRSSNKTISVSLTRAHKDMTLNVAPSTDRNDADR